MTVSGVKTALIAMSGGVDSSVAAILAARMGYECTGVTMLLAPDDESLCSARSDVLDLNNYDAAEAAKKLGIPHQTLDFRREFGEGVIEPFVSSYLKGETPNPCVNCNAEIKFGLLYEYARSHGFDKLITGHYANIVKEAGENFRLAKASDTGKDQSYFLYSVTPEKLKHILFPLGGLTKNEVRRIAADEGLFYADRDESQDICFIPEGGYAAFIERYSGKSSVPGNYIDLSGKIIGRHKGISRYTIGQRKGLGIALGRPVFVKEIRYETNEIVLSDEEDVFTGQIEIGEIVMHTEVPAYAGVMIRYRADPVRAAIKQISESHLLAAFDKPVRAPASGQAAVLYDGDLVIGGGRIV